MCAHTLCRPTCSDIPSSPWEGLCCAQQQTCNCLLHPSMTLVRYSWSLLKQMGLRKVQQCRHRSCSFAIHSEWSVFTGWGKSFICPILRNGPSAVGKCCLCIQLSHLSSVITYRILERVRTHTSNWFFSLSLLSPFSHPISLSPLSHTSE